MLTGLSSIRIHILHTYSGQTHYLIHTGTKQYGIVMVTPLISSRALALRSAACMPEVCHAFHMEPPFAFKYDQRHLSSGQIRPPQLTRFLQNVVMLAMLLCTISFR